MTLREIDEALAGWKSRLDAAAQNLMDLQAQPTYRRLTGCSGVSQPPLTGATAARVTPALAGIARVFELLDLLRATVERADALRGDLPALFGADEKIHEIAELLRGESIHLPAVDVPLEQRTLLDGARSEVCISPTDLLAAMVKEFQAAKDAVMAVDKAWSTLAPMLDSTRARIAALRARAKTPIELDSAERALDEICAKVKADPLGASVSIDGVEAALAAHERVHREIESAFAAAHAQLEAVVHLHTDAVDACRQSRLKIAAAAALPSPAAKDKVEGLCDWLRRLEKKYAEGMVDPVAVGLRNWSAAAEDCMAQERAALAANRTPLDARNELRGRLDAFKAKARAYGVAEDDTLAALAHQAEAILHTRPTDLDRATAAVTAYERALNGGRQ
jgi:hypothetical protein